MTIISNIFHNDQVGKKNGLSPSYLLFQLNMTHFGTGPRYNQVYHSEKIIHEVLAENMASRQVTSFLTPKSPSSEHDLDILKTSILTNFHDNQASRKSQK